MWWQRETAPSAWLIQPSLCLVSQKSSVALQVTGLETASRGAQPQSTMSLLLTTMFLKGADFQNAGPIL